MEVTIFYRNTFQGGDGWQYYPKRIIIGDNCPVCGGKRGIPYGYNFCEDGEWYHVDKWENPCGHVDSYRDCFFEWQKLNSEQNDERSAATEVL